MLRFMLLLLSLPASSRASHPSASTTALQIVNWSERRGSKALPSNNCTLQIYVYTSTAESWQLTSSVPVTEAVTILPCYQQPAVRNSSGSDNSLAAAARHCYTWIVSQLKLQASQIASSTPVHHLASVTCASAAVLPPHGLHYVCDGQQADSMPSRQHVLYALLVEPSRRAPVLDLCMTRVQSESAFTLQCYGDEYVPSWAAAVQQWVRTAKAAHKLQKVVRSIAVVASLSHIAAVVQWWRLTVKTVAI